MTSQEMCACGSVLDGYRYDPPTESYVHKACGKPREGGPTTASVLAFIDRVLAARERRTAARG